MKGILDVEGKQELAGRPRSIGPEKCSRQHRRHDDGCVAATLPLGNSAGRATMVKMS